jgi:hypothetical protein
MLSIFRELLITRASARAHAPSFPISFTGCVINHKVSQNEKEISGNGGLLDIAWELQNIHVIT